MKILFFFITFLYSFNANSLETSDYRDLNVGGITIFDNLNDFLTNRQIRDKTLENHYTYLNNPNMFTTIQVIDHPEINRKYPVVEINFKREDRVPVVHSITGGEFYSDINLCYKDMIQVADQISTEYPNFEKFGPSTKIHDADPSGKSDYTGVNWNSNDYKVWIRIECYDWNEKLTRKKGWKDNLSYNISTINFVTWLSDLK